MAADPTDAGAVEYWGRRAAEYDAFIRRVVPRYDEQILCLLEYLPERAERVLELGCGTGNLSLRLAERWPRARFTFVDAAPEMLDTARSRLAAARPDTAALARYVNARFEDLELDPDSVDVVVASFSLHHVRDVAPIYPRIAAALAARGRFLMLDGIRGATEAEHSLHMRRWASHWDRMLSPQERDDVATHVREHDHYRTLAEHFDLLRRAGFVDVDCVWRDGLFGLVTAHRDDG